uniref:Reverse transcriptase domain-containing protein n=1 Tax=Tanacetum cinerariifolium TaxID=118510 RepID=A0A6L2JMN6_TANCI|nr:hypothetical protein [Tanacetum cinerariifolium]
MHNYHLDRGVSRCAFKVDIQKAYDTVDWEFLRAALFGFGFHDRKRGLRQGDPLSPYLFTLVMEVFTLMLHRRVCESSNFTYHRYCSDLDLINLCFADDLFLFAHGDVNSASIIKEALDEFKDASGLNPSMPKNKAYFCNVLNHTKLAILHVLSFEEDRLPVKYLGVLLVSSRLIFRDCKELIDKVQNRVNDWKNKSLLIAGRLQLIQSVLGSLNVRECIHGGMWSWPNDWMVKYPILSSIPVPVLNDAKLDVLEWRNSDGSFDTFSVQRVWETIRPRDNEVPWYDLVWFSSCIPRHAVHMWLIMKKRSKTQDALSSWDVVAGLMVVCPLCLSASGSSLDSIVSILMPVAKQKSFKSCIGKLTLAVAAYFVWQQRNLRLFKNSKRSIQEVVDCVMSSVRLELLSCRFKKSKDAMLFSRCPTAICIVEVVGVEFMVVKSVLSWQWWSFEFVVIQQEMEVARNEIDVIQVHINDNVVDPLATGDTYDLHTNGIGHRYFEGRKPESEVHVSPSSSAQSKKYDDKTKREAKGKSLVESSTRYRNLSAEFEDFSDNNINEVNATDSQVLAVGQISTNITKTFSAAELEGITYYDDEEDVGAEADFTNLETTITVSPIPTTKVHKDHHVTQIISDLSSATQTRSMSRVAQDQGGLSQINNDDFHTFFAPVARIEAIRLFLAYASFMGFMVYQMDVKSAFLYGTIEEEVYVCQPPGFEDPDHPDKVYKVVKELYGLHQAPRAWYETLANYLLENGFQRGKIDQTLFIKRQKGDILLVQIYVDDIIFGSTNKDLCKAFEKLMKDKFQMTSMGELTFFLDIEKPLLKDPDGKDVDVPTYRSMIGSLMLNVTSVGSKFLLFGLTNWCCSLNAVRKKVIITEATIRDALRLDDAEGIDCLPNEEIFTELSRIGYEKPSTKLTFYKEFFSSRKFNFSKYIFDSLVRNVDSSTKFYMYPCFLKVMIRQQVGDLSSHSTKYSFLALTQKVFANMRRVGKGCSGIETPLFEGMIVAQQVGEGAADVNVEDVSSAGVAAEGVASAADDEVHAAVDEPSIPSPPPPTQPPPPSQDIPSTSQNAGFSMDLLQNLLDTCTTLTRRVEHLEQDKIAQALEITKSKHRVKKLERRSKASKLMRLKKVRTAQRIDTSDDIVLDDVSKQERIIADMDADKDVTLKDVAAVAKDIQDAKIEEKPAELQEVVEVVTTAKLITEVVTAASATITAVAPTLTTAPSDARRRKGVVISDPEETATPFTIIHTEPKSKDKGKGIMVHEHKPLKKQAQIEQDEAYARELEAELNKNIDWDEVIDHVQRKEKEVNAVKRYQAFKRKPQTEAQARKNMMIYLRNMVGFKMDNFKGMKYDDIHPIFEKYFNFNVAFLVKTNEQIEEEDSRALKRISEIPNDDDDVYTEATPLSRKVPVVDYAIYTENNKPYYKIIRADGSPQLFLSFLSLLRNFDRKDLEVLWELVKERFASSKPKNFSDDFLLTTLTYMFEKPDLQAQMILLVERRYPLTRFTLDQLINNVRLEVEEESEVSLKLLRFVRQQ